MYLIEIWGGAPKKYMKPLQVLQNKCLKSVFKLPMKTPSKTLFNDYCKNIPNIHSMVVMKTCKFVHGVIHNHIFHNVEFQNPTHRYNTRKKNQLSYPRVKRNYSIQAISIAGPKIFNTLPKHLKTINAPRQFNIHLKEWLVKTQYK